MDGNLTVPVAAGPSCYEQHPGQVPHAQHPGSLRASAPETRGAQGKSALGWQAIGRRMIKNIKPSAYPVLIHDIPDTVSIQDLIARFSAFGSLIDLRYGYTDKTQGVAVGLFRKETSVAKVMGVRKRIRRGDQWDPDPAGAGNPTAQPPPADSATAAAAPPHGDKRRKLATNSRRSTSEPSGPAAGTTSSSMTAAGPSDLVGRDDKRTYHPTNSRSSADTSNSLRCGKDANRATSAAPSSCDWLKIALKEAAFYFHSETKSYTLLEPGGAVSEEIDWAAEPKRFAKAMKRAKQQDAHRKRTQAQLRSDEEHDRKRSRTSPPLPVVNDASGSPSAGIAKIAKVSSQVEDSIAGFIREATTASQLSTAQAGGAVDPSPGLHVGSVATLADDPSVQGTATDEGRGWSTDTEDGSGRLTSRPKQATVDEVASYKAFRTAPVFSPTAEELDSPIEYIRRVVMPAATDFGLAVIRPPDHATEASKAHKQLMQRLAKPFRYRRQLKYGNQDEKKKMNFKSWQACDHVDQRRPEWPTPADDEQDRDAEFFSVVRMEDDNARPCYASEIPCNQGVLDGALPWSPCRLPLLPQSPLRVLGWPSSGINAPQLFIARRFSFFAWHTEDLDLFSCNYMHFGAPKTWYAVSSEQRDDFEKAAESIECGRTLLKVKLKGKGKSSDKLSEKLPTATESVSVEKVTNQERQKFHRASVAYHRVHMTDPAMLATKGIKITRYIQRPGDLVITLPGAYHGGFSHGVSVAESSNFADEAWLDTGLAAEKRMKSVGLQPAFDMNSLIADWNEIQRVVSTTVAPVGTDGDSVEHIRNRTSDPTSDVVPEMRSAHVPDANETAGCDSNSLAEQGTVALLATSPSQQAQQVQTPELHISTSMPQVVSPATGQQRDELAGDLNARPMTPEGRPLLQDNRLSVVLTDTLRRTPALPEGAQQQKTLGNTQAQTENEPAMGCAAQISVEHSKGDDQTDAAIPPEILEVIDDIITVVAEMASAGAYFDDLAKLHPKVARAKSTAMRTRGGSGGDSASIG